MSDQRELRPDAWADQDDEYAKTPIKPLTREEAQALVAKNPSISPCAATVVVPGALMARGMTSRLTSLAPGVSAVSFMLWEFGKIGVSVVMLALAPKLVPGLSWPALLVALIVCIKVYWVALSWRGRKKI